MINQLLDGLRRVAAFARQQAHFPRHHGKAASLIPGMCRFDGGVQRQNIGLKRHVINDRHNAAHFGRTLHNRRHRGVYRLHHPIAACRHRPRLISPRTGQSGIAAVALNVGFQVGNVRGDFFQLLRLPCRLVIQLLIPLRQRADIAHH